MEEKTVMLIGGKITGIEGMEIKGECWEFLQQDPHLYIQFEQPVQRISLNYKMEEASFDNRKDSSDGSDAYGEQTTIYYSRDSEDYSEIYTVKEEFYLGKGMHMDIEWDKPVSSIRLDLVENKGQCRFSTFFLEGIPCVRGNDAKEKVIILTHELSKTGAPILAYNIAKKMKDQGKEVMALSLFPGNGYLEKRYGLEEIPVICLNSHPRDEQKWIRIDGEGKRIDLSEEEHFKHIAEKLWNNGYRTVIANTVVSGICIGKLKEYGFKVISLIHEMKTTIENYGFIEPGKSVAKYADYVVFPNEFVKEDFLTVFEKVNGKVAVRPQGVYLEESEGENLEILKKYGLEGTTYVMSSGTGELRKGVDLFVSGAIMLLNRKPDVHFVWTGDFQSKELECWLADQIHRSGYEGNFHFISFIKDNDTYGQILKHAKAFWGLSREDPFPSTVLEAMNYEIPVVGWSNTGGIHTMIENGGGILVDHFDMEEVVEKTCKILDRKIRTRKNMLTRAKKYAQSLNFEKYVEFLDECVKSIEE